MKNSLRIIGIVAAFGIAFVAPAKVGAQETAAAMRERLRLPQPATFEVGARGARTAPGIAIGVPTGFGADYGDAFAAVAFQARTRYGTKPDGGVVAGFGVGDARRLVGLELAFTGFGTYRSCCRGGISPKLHRVISGNTSVSVGYENVYTWGHMGGEEEATDAGRSLYAAATTILLLRPDPSSFFGSVALTAGAGNGRFRRESDILAGRERINPFFSAGVRVIDQASAIASWTGQDLVAGASITPIPGFPLFVTPAVADLTTHARFILGIGYGLDYSSIF